MALITSYVKRPPRKSHPLSIWCRVHETLRVTPAMELGLTDHIWSVAELINEAQATSRDLLPLETPPPTRGPGASRSNSMWSEEGRLVDPE